MGTLIQCDKCKGNAGKAHRYGLRRYNRLAPGEQSENPTNPYQGRFTSAGSIFLCDPCWEAIAAPHMVPNRRPKRVRNQHMDEAVPNPRTHPWRKS